MTTSFTITKEMRKEVAQNLAQKAIKKAVSTLLNDLAATNVQFWKEYQEHLRRISGVPASKWSGLIQIGMARAITGINPMMRNENDHLVSPLSVSFHNGPGSQSLIDLIHPSQRQKFQEFFRDRYVSRTHGALRFTFYKAIPEFDGAASKFTETFGDVIAEISEQFYAIKEAAFDVYETSLAVLNGCRTSRQVEDVFPEAAKLLPKPVKKTTAMVPKEFVDALTAKINEGVPKK